MAQMLAMVGNEHQNTPITNYVSATTGIASSLTVFDRSYGIRQGLRKGADNKVLKEKLSLNWTGPFKIIAFGPSSAADTPDGRPLGDKLLYFDLPSNLSGPAAKPRVTVARCKPCANPYDADNLGISLPALRNMSYTPSRPSRLHTTSPRMTSPPLRSNRCR